MDDRAVFAAALGSAREALLRAVRDWRALGGRDEDLALLVDGEKGAPPTVAPQSRAHLERTIPDFEPTIAIELVRHRAGHAPAVVTLPGMVRRIYWIDLATGDAAAAF
ncbi:MAG: hypothetical protein ACRELB_24845 [Polyangiaceae bacterium]